MLIDPRGLLNGQRVRACSDEAQLHFPRLLSASNTYGRFRMSVEWLQGVVYAGFKVKPTKEQLTGWMREYHENYLLFVYKDEKGAGWAQWDIPTKMLGRYRTAADGKTPAPPQAEFEAWHRAYIDSLREKSTTDSDDISGNFGSIPVSASLRKVLQTSENPKKLSEVCENFGGDVGVGVGVGVAKDIAPAAPPDERHRVFKAAVFDSWKRSGQRDDPAWDGSEGRSLDELLKAMPKLTLERFETCLRHREKSATNLSERPRRWIRSITDYESGPLDAYGKPLARPQSPELVQASRRTPDAQETATRHQREAEERLQVLAEWRDLRIREPDEYEREAPGWAKQAIAAERKAVA